MIPRLVLFVLLSGAYWVGMLFLAFLALGAPCGLAPDESCELDGPTLLGAALGTLGPIGTLLAGAMIYAGLVWLSRQRKSYR